MDKATSAHKTVPVTLWTLTAEVITVRNFTITCPACKGKEYIVGRKAQVCISGGADGAPAKRGYLFNGYACPHCKRDYSVVEA